MTDETTTDLTHADKTTDVVAPKEMTTEDKLFATPRPEPVSAVQRLRDFEDGALGADAPRIAGKVERGHGSLFGRLSDGRKAHHAKLEKLVETEAKLAEANAALLKAGDEHTAALKAADDAASE